LQIGNFDLTYQRICKIEPQLFFFSFNI
jgi:hypothetical protein